MSGLEVLMATPQGRRTTAASRLATIKPPGMPTPPRAPAAAAAAGSTGVSASPVATTPPGLPVPPPPRLTGTAATGNILTGGLSDLGGGLAAPTASTASGLPSTPAAPPPSPLRIAPSAPATAVPSRLGAARSLLDPPAGPTGFARRIPILPDPPPMSEGLADLFGMERQPRPLPPAGPLGPIPRSAAGDAIVDNDQTDTPFVGSAAREDESMVDPAKRRSIRTSKDFLAVLDEAALLPSEEQQGLAHTARLHPKALEIAVDIRSLPGLSPSGRKKSLSAIRGKIDALPENLPAGLFRELLDDLQPVLDKPAAFEAALGRNRILFRDPRPPLNIDFEARVREDFARFEARTPFSTLPVATQRAGGTESRIAFSRKGDDAPFMQLPPRLARSIARGPESTAEGLSFLRAWRRGELTGDALDRRARDLLIRNFGPDLEGTGEDTIDDSRYRIFLAAQQALTDGADWDQVAALMAPVLMPEAFRDGDAAIDFILDMTPGIGDFGALLEAIEAIENGDVGGAVFAIVALGLGLAGGRVVRAVGKAATATKAAGGKTLEAVRRLGQSARTEGREAADAARAVGEAAGDRAANTIEELRRTAGQRGAETLEQMAEGARATGEEAAQAARDLARSARDAGRRTVEEIGKGAKATQEKTAEVLRALRRRADELRGRRGSPLDDAKDPADGADRAPDAEVLGRRGDAAPAEGAAEGVPEDAAARRAEAERREDVAISDSPELPKTGNTQIDAQLRGDVQAIRIAVDEEARKPRYQVVGRIEGNAANDDSISRMRSTGSLKPTEQAHPPYRADVPAYILSVNVDETEFVRLTSNPEKPEGFWLMPKSIFDEIMKSPNAPAVLKQLYAIPGENPPTHFVVAKLPAGVRVRVGAASPREGWGNGGGEQIELLGPPKVDWFSEPQRLEGNPGK